MDVLSWIMVCIFVGASVALFVTRKIMTTVGRMVLVLIMGASAGIAALRFATIEEHREAVWHERGPVWSKTPVKVYWDRTEFAAYNEVFAAAMGTWNERIGCKVLEAGERNESQILIRGADGTQCGKETLLGAQVVENPNASASAWFCNGYVDVQIRRIDDVGLAFRVALHELGHSLGLDHDDKGAMAKEVLEPKSGDYPEHLLPSNKDVAAIKARYCQ